MNKAITDGVDLMPPEFAAGLDVWSDLDGTPGSSTYDGTNNAALVLADSDFGSCLELFKTQSTQKLRFMGQTPLLAGCYLQIKVRVKAMSGNLPSVQIAGYAANGSGAHVGGLVEVAPPVALTTYGEVVELTAIVGVGNRTGVDMVWGLTPVYGHFGINLTGSNSGVVRIDDISIEDATLVFHRNLMDWVDVRDFGAIGNGVSDDSAAFEAADAAAMGRTVLVSKGIYKLDSHVTFESKVRFEGTVVMPASIRLSLTRNFDLPSYADAFGDEVTGLKKALQAMFNFSDHESLDMCGRRVSLTEPLDVHAAVDNIDVFSSRRVIRNGQLQADNSAGWEDEVRTSTATYSAAVKTRLSNVTNVAQNYIDNASIEWGNEHDEAPDGASSFSFGGLTVIGNIFTSSESAPWFRFIQIKPFGPNHFINGLSITGNIFKHTGGGTIERMDLVDESIGVLNPNKFQNITVTGNTYNNVDARTTNPVTVEMEEVTANALWSFDFAPYLPFGGKARRVVALLPQNEIKSSTNVGIYTMPYAVSSLGTNGTEINLHWSQAVKGKAHVTVWTDNQA